MKKIFKSLILVAAAAMGFTACQEELQGEDYANEGTVVVSFVADTPDTKTSVDTSGDVPVFAWDDSETFAVLEQIGDDELAEATSVAYEKVDGKAKITATFGAGYYGTNMYQYVTIYPASGYVGAESLAAATLSLPAEQTMASGSYDPAADLMVSTIVKKPEPPTEAQMVEFTRLAAVAKMTIEGLEVGEQVEKVIFKAEGKNLAGTVTADLANPHGFAVAEGVENVTVNTNSAGDVYFTVLPTTLEAGDAYTVTVITDKYLYVKNGTIPAEKSLVFEAGMVTRFNVDMSGVAPSEKWVLVKDASTLKTGDVVTIASVNYDYIVGADMGSSYPYASDTKVVKFNDYLYHPISISDVENMVQKFTLVKRDNNRTAFDFYNGATDYEGDDNSGFLCVSGSNKLILQDYYSVDTQFDVTIDNDGIATVYATNAVGSGKQMMFYYSSYSACYFYCYSSINDAKRIYIYKQDGAEGDIPVVAANVTKEDVVIPEEGAQIATKIEEVVFNYVGDWTISVSDNADWLEVTYDSANNCLKYTAQENTSGKRDATVTITATLDGQDDITWPFTVTQKGAPTEISIAEFITLPKDENTEKTIYKLIGKVAVIPSSATAAWTIEDASGNEAFISYLKTEGGVNVKGNVDIQVGDVIAFTTFANGSAKGGSSTYPSIYKGHYTLVASADAPVDYEGGSVNVNVAVQKFGHIVAPNAISVAEVTMGGNPFSNYTFTDNGNGTATAVVTFDQNTTSGTREVSLNFSAGSPLAVATSVSVMQDVDPALKKGWWLVTDVNDLKAGDMIIIAATEQVKGKDYAINTSSSGNTRASTVITKVGSALEDVSENVQVYSLEVVDGLYAFKGTLGDGANKYIYASSSSTNNMKTNSSLDDNGKWTISIASDGAATIIAQGTNTRNVMQYNNVATSAPSFYATAGDKGAVCLYKYYE